MEENILQMIYDLKKSKDPLNATQTNEFYTYDSDFDVVITVRLKEKKSQLQIGMEMFGK